jgi:transcriptional regulator with XRE-family HTH domain
MTEKQIIGDAVAARRRALEVSQLQLATLAGVSRGTVRNIETASVAPIEATWSALEPMLAWAPGTLRRLQNEFEPYEVLPAELAALILRRILQTETQQFSPFADLAGRYRRLMSSARPEGALTDDQRIELSDFLDALRDDDEDDVEIEELQDRIDLWFKESTTTARLPMRDVTRIVPGTAVRHLEFGHGNVLSVAGSGEKKKAEIAFVEPWGRKTLLLRFAPLKIQQTPPVATVDTSPRKEDESLIPRTPPTMEHNFDLLGDDVKRLLSEGQIIDYSVKQPAHADNVAVVTLLLRKASGPLSAGDRKYIARAMTQMAAEQQSSEDDEWPDPDPAPSPGLKAARNAAKAAATAPQAAPGGGFGGGFSDEPPF